MAAGSFLNIPSPEHGASTKILSKKWGNFFDKRSGLSLVTTTFVAPHLSRFSLKSFALLFEISFTTKRPLLSSELANAVDFPPGAAHKSSTLSPGFTLRETAGYIADGS